MQDEITRELLAVIGALISINISVYFFYFLPKTQNKTLLKISKCFEEKREIEIDFGVENIITIDNRKIISNIDQCFLNTYSNDKTVKS